MFHKRDPRRYQALVDYLVQEFCSTDYNGESSLNAVKALCFFRAFYEEQNWKFSEWMDLAVERVWAEISSEHDEVCYFCTPCRECVIHLIITRSAHISASFSLLRARLRWGSLRTLGLDVHATVMIVPTETFSPLCRDFCAGVPDDADRF